MTPRDAWRAAEAFIEITAVRVALRIAPQRVMRRASMNERPACGATFEDLVALFAQVAREHPLQPNCLQRSLALQRMLARRGVPTTLRIAVGRRPAMLPGHAWLEHGGQIVNDAREVVARYEPLVIVR